jgi:hypothetical protein
MRASGGTKWALALSVVSRTKSRIARLAAPSFQEARGSGEDCACAGEESRVSFGQRLQEIREGFVGR